VKIKKYVVTNIREAMDMIKRELGDKAIILSTRKVKKGGFLGIGAKTFLEVTAMAEEDKKIVKEENRNVYKLQELLVKNRREREGREFEELKRMIEDLKNMLIVEKNKNLPAGISKVIRGFEKQEVDSEIVSKIAEYLRITYGDVDPNSDDLLRKLSDYLVPFVKANVPELSGKILFVGPTGVGKTTTLAKIAAILKIEMKKNIAILTLDTYRIAAAEQLKTYATIMDIPMRIAYTPKEASIELSAMVDYDAILMDTAGRSQKNDLQMGELKALVDLVKPDIIFLVLSMNYRYEDLKDMIKRFSIVSPSHLILTKLDETDSLGHLINAPYYSNIPLSYITNGQRVPEDIFEANTYEVSRMVVSEVLKYARSG